MRLYNYWRSSASYRVRIALRLKGISYEYVAVPLTPEAGEHQHGQAHFARNPMRQVPVLEWEDDGVVRHLAQSIAIIEYLDERYPEPPLLPTDRFLRAQARMVAEHMQSGIQPLHNLAVLRHVKELAGGAEGTDTAWARYWTKRGLEALEAIVTPLAGRYLVGDSITVADICLVPQLYFARRVKLDLTPFPVLTRVDEILREHDAFREACPENQPDAPHHERR